VAIAATRQAFAAHDYRSIWEWCPRLLYIQLGHDRKDLARTRQGVDTVSLAAYTKRREEIMLKTVSASAMTIILKSSRLTTTRYEEPRVLTSHRHDFSTINRCTAFSPQ